MKRQRSGIEFGIMYGAACRLKIKALIPTLFVFMFLCNSAMAQTVRVENPRALPVVDKANILTPAQADDLSSRILGLAETDGVQLVVLTIPTTGDEDIFSFSQRTATEWGIGQKEHDSGVLFTIASKDRKARIQVGYGLEGRLTDALSKRILSQAVVPAFRKGEYYTGISKGVDAIIATVKGEYKAPAEKQSVSAGNVLLWITALIVIFTFISSMRRGGRGGKGGGGGGGLLAGVLLGNVWTSGGGSSGGWGHSGGDFGGSFGGGLGGGGFGGGGAGASW